MRRCFCRAPVAGAPHGDGNVNPTLFPARFLRCRPTPLYGRCDTEIFKSFACLQRRRKPSRLQSAPRPRFRWIVRVAIFRGNCPPRTTSNSIVARSAGSEAIQPAKSVLNGPAFLDHFGTKGGGDLLFKLRQLVERH
jgi:hypothetical protein